MLTGRDGSACHAPLTLDSTGVVLAACKRAEKSADTIVRLVERYGKSAQITMKYDTARYSQAGISDLLEWREMTGTVDDGTLHLAFHPYEIKTVRLRKKQEDGQRYR